jgi:hypothetical protein
VSDLYAQRLLQLPPDDVTIDSLLERLARRVGELEAELERLRAGADERRG